MAEHSEASSAKLKREAKLRVKISRILIFDEIRFALLASLRNAILTNFERLNFN
jgi:hypothetical protein